MTSDQDEYDYLFKILLVGDSAVGKTSLALKIAENTFTETHVTTIGVDFKITNYSYPSTNQKAKLQLWDTAGQERFRVITQSYYRGAHGVFLVFDFGDKESLIHLKDWIKDIRTYAVNDPYILIIGNKYDLPTNKIEVDEVDVYELVDKLNIKYVSVSAKVDTQVKLIERIVGPICEEMRRKFPEKYQRADSDSSKANLTGHPVDSKGCSC